METRTARGLEGAGANPELERVALDLAQRGWSVNDAVVPPLLSSQLGVEARQLWDEGAFRRAGVGRGADLQLRPEIRSDHVHWLDPSICGGARSRYLGLLEELRLSLNRNLFLGLFDFEGHLALYPPGSRYRRHLDQFRGVERRTVTCILYLNRDWRPEDGGQLRIYTEPAAPGHYEEILPVAGRLVCFLSARYPHEVLPSRRERLSLTGWFRTRADGVVAA